MGNNFGRSISNNNIAQPEDIKTKLDDCSRHELIKYMKNMTLKNVNLSGNKEAIKNIELENTKLVPMAIEMYEKMFKLFGSPKASNQKRLIYHKRMCSVKPQFEIEDLIKPTLISIYFTEDNIPLDTIPFTIEQEKQPLVTREITLEEYNDSFNNITVKKDIIGISKKILKYLSVYLKIRIINIYNEILENPEKIRDSCIAKCKYIYKVSKKGPVTETGSFRQILMIPNIINQMHRILNLRLSAYMLQNNYIDTNIQKGGIIGLKFSIFEQVYKLKTVIKDANKNKKSCVILYLDIKDAFGNLKLYKLYEILEMYQVEKKFIDYLKFYYDNLLYYIDLEKNTQPINLIEWRDGLVQGCSLSQLLFIIALNYVLKYLDTIYKNECGYEIDKDNKILFTAYIDDISIICNNMISVQKVLEKLEFMCKILGLAFCKEKSALMVINDNSESNNENLTNIKKVNMHKYLGEDISVDDTCKSYVQFIKNLMGRLKSIDCRKCSNADKISMFEKLIIPWMQRKIVLMYDIGTRKKFKIISFINVYMKKWGVTKHVNLFCNISNIINNSRDDVIKKIGLDPELKDELILDDYIFNSHNLKFNYSQMNDDDTMVDYDEKNN